MIMVQIVHKSLIITTPWSIAKGLNTTQDSVINNSV